MYLKSTPSLKYLSIYSLHIGNIKELIKVVECTLYTEKQKEMSKDIHVMPRISKTKQMFQF